MSYYLYKLRFTSPVRFGTDKGASGLSMSGFTASADTLFSALCDEWIQILGLDSFKDFISWVQAGDLLLSDLLPFNHSSDSAEGKQDCKIYIPKPVMLVKGEQTKKSSMGDSVMKKKFKKITHIQVDAIQSYIEFQQAGDTDGFAMDPSQVFSEIKTTRASISHNPESLPYHVASVKFLPDAGLCFVVRMNDDKKLLFDKVLESLGMNGIGGKRSSGYGKFVVENDGEKLEQGPHQPASYEALSRMLHHESDTYLAISCILPSKKDFPILQDNRTCYQLSIRKGFVYSRDHSDTNMKRKQVVMVRAGSCMPTRMEGTVADTNPGGNHEVYRYGKGLFLGVSL